MRFHRISLTLLIVMLTRCLQLHAQEVTPMAVWPADQRTGLERASQERHYIEKLISVPLNPWASEDGNFDLYYFVAKPWKRGVRTVLFCAGGPGELVVVKEESGLIASILDQSRANDGTYNLVFFHQRGSGFSQIPASSKFDSFLRSSYIVEDIEKIRQDLARQGFLGPDGKWDAIIGYSYGTVLAQQYAHRYENKVKKLVLKAPLSMHKFVTVEGFEEYKEDVNRIRREILENIYKRRDFESLTNDDKEEVLRLLFGRQDESDRPGIFKQVENAFGSEQFVADQYCQLDKNQELHKHHLSRFGRKLFEALRDIRFVGWQSINTVREAELGKIIAVQLIPELVWKLYGTPEDMRLEQGSDECFEDSTQRSYRNLYVVRTYDGLYPSLLKEWVEAGKTNIHAALRKSSGQAENGLNKVVERIRIADDAPIEPWDPAKYRHNVPTLILRGAADPVTASGQAEYYFTDALRGQRSLLEFDGVGHWLALPTIRVKDPFLSGTITIDPPNLRPGESMWVATILPGGEVVPNSPEGLDPNLTLGDIPRIEKSAPIRVSVRLLNISENAVDDPEREWTVNYPLFDGIVRLDPRRIPGKKSGWTSGEVIPRKVKIEVKPPANLEAGLRYTGRVRVDNWSGISVQIQNDGPSQVNGSPKNWVYKGQDLVGPCYAPDPISSRECFISAFIEMEYPDFLRFKSWMVGKLETDSKLRVTKDLYTRVDN